MNMRFISNFKYIKNMSSIRLSGTNSKRNIDQKEIDHFASISKDWLDPNGSAKPLHQFNPLRIQLIKKGLCSIGAIPESTLENHDSLKGLKILEVGCGGGILTKELAKLQCEIIGLEPGEEMLNVAKEDLKNYPELKNIKYISDTIEEHSQTNEGIYDAVLASEVIEHVTTKESFLEACVKALKPGGFIFISTSNKTWLSRICVVFLAEKVFRFVPVGTHDWNQFISPDDCSILLDKYGCSTIYRTGLMYEFWRKRWAIANSDILHYALQAVKK